MSRTLLTACAIALAASSAVAQEPPAELPTTQAPSAAPGSNRRIPIGAYGEAALTHQGSQNEATLRRLVLFVGHSFSEWARLYTEIEFENVRELEVEQAYLELTPAKRLGIRAGLLVVPLGIVNQFHEPPTFNGVDRPLVDQKIIPSTWRELGAGIFGEVAEGLHYQLYVMSGLDASRFSPTEGFARARGGGAEARASDAAFAGRVNFDRWLGTDFGASFYTGGAGQSQPELGGVRVTVVEADARYKRSGLDLRAEYARAFISGADRVTNFLRTTSPALAAIPSAMQGFYGEAGYDVLRLFSQTTQQLVPFVRYENIKTRAALPDVLAPGESHAGQFLFAGVSYRPHPQIVFKADYRATLSGDDANRLSGGIGFMY